MQYTDGEIVRSYRTARDKAHQINILAQLNACHPEKIRKILRRNGISVSQRNGRSKVWTGDEEVELVRLHASGIGPKRIAQMMQKSKASVAGKIFYMQQIGQYQEIKASL